MVISCVNSGPSMVVKPRASSPTATLSPRAAILTALNWAFQVIESGPSSSSAHHTASSPGLVRGRRGASTAASTTSTRSGPSSTVPSTSPPSRPTPPLISSYVLQPTDPCLVGKYSKQTLAHALQDIKYVGWVLAQTGDVVARWSGAMLTLKNSIGQYYALGTDGSLRCILPVPAPMDLASIPADPAPVVSTTEELRQAVALLMQSDVADLRAAAIADHEAGSVFSVPIYQRVFELQTARLDGLQ